MNIQEILKNNKEWRSKYSQQYFTELAQGQSPHVLYIGCSDSRVCPEIIMGMSLGDVFVHRNIANVVQNTDMNAISVITYAVEVLEVDHIILCGHYGCGGVKAAMDVADLGVLNSWIHNIRDVYALHENSLDAISDDEERYKCLVEHNVREQCTNLLKVGAVHKAYHNKNLHIYGCVFDIATGKLINLEIAPPPSM